MTRWTQINKNKYIFEHFEYDNPGLARISLFINSINSYYPVRSYYMHVDTTERGISTVLKLSSMYVRFQWTDLQYNLVLNRTLDISSISFPNKDQSPYSKGVTIRFWYVILMWFRHCHIRVLEMSWLTKLLKRKARHAGIERSTTSIIWKVHHSTLTVGMKSRVYYIKYILFYFFTW